MRLGSAAIVGLACTVLGGCQSTGKPAADGSAPYGSMVSFVPASTVAQIRTGAGPYPGLFSADSYAIWTGPELTRQRRQESAARGEPIEAEADALAPRLDEAYVVIECSLESVFADMSIGYDAVGLRGVEVALETPTGEKAAPVQVAVGRDLREEPRGALRSYRRTTLIVFRRDALNLVVPAGGASARLVLAAHDTTFFFEWPAQTPAVTNVPFGQRPEVKAAKLGFNEFYQTLRAAGRTFD